MTDLEKPKKQFKSQSVNSLFRQQNATVEAGSKDELKKPKATASGGKRLKLVPRKSRTLIHSSKKATPSISASPTVPVQVQTQVQAQTYPQTNEITPQYIAATSLGQVQEAATPKSVQSVQSVPSVLSSNVEEIDPLHTPILPRSVGNSSAGDANMWSDLQSRINIDASITRVQLDRVATYSTDSTRTWTSPSSKLSSFRRSVAAPGGFQSLNQSPLSKPADSQSRLFSDFKVHEPRSSTSLAESMQWSSTNIWSSEDRSLSTKSDSAVPWSPFDIECLNLDAPTPSRSSQLTSPFESGSRNGSRTSRFFPSPVVEQNPSFDQYPRQHSSGFDNPFMIRTSTTPPPRAQFDSIQSPFMGQPRQLSFTPQPRLEPKSQPQPQSQSQYSPHPEQVLNLDREASLPTGLLTEDPVPAPKVKFSNCTIRMEQDLFPLHFHSDSPVPISLYNSHNYYGTDENHDLYHPARRNTVIEPQSYPEGFASTFYKRGVNNFMFIRELQPKLVTSKHRDTVEVRVSFPAPAKEGDEDDALIKMRCHIVNVDVRDLEGRIGGIKVSKGGPPTRGKFGMRGGHRGFGKRG